MKIRCKLLIVLSFIVLGLNARAADFFSTGPADHLFNLGVRVGLNTSNASISSKQMRLAHSSWGTGFDAGVVADINFNGWLTLQPGFFYQSSSNDYFAFYTGQSGYMSHEGHTLYYMFNVPLMVSVRFNLGNDFRWSVDAGPYLSFGLGHNDTFEISTPQLIMDYKKGYFENRNRFQWGVKFGTGLQFRDHYYVGIHYMAGCRNVYNNTAHISDGLSGRHKSWTFTLGYDF